MYLNLEVITYVLSSHSISFSNITINIVPLFAWNILKLVDTKIATNSIFIDKEIKIYYYNKRRSYVGFDDLKEDFFEYIEGFYNIRRPHSANNMLSPSENEEVYKLR